MIVYPILNFVLPLMFSSFVLVGNPKAGCIECSKKADLNVSESKKAEAVARTNQAVIKDELTEEMDSGEMRQKIPLQKKE